MRKFFIKFFHLVTKKKTGHASLRNLSAYL